MKTCPCLFIKLRKENKYLTRCFQKIPVVYTAGTDNVVPVTLSDYRSARVCGDFSNSWFSAPSFEDDETCENTVLK